MPVNILLSMNMHCIYISIEIIIIKTNKVTGCATFRWSSLILKRGLIQGLHWQLWKSNVLYLGKYYTEFLKIFVSRLP